MVVVLAAALAYRYHSQQQQQGEDGSPLERKLSEQWQRSESFRQSSSNIVRSALSCSTPQHHDNDSTDNSTSMQEELSEQPPSLNEDNNSMSDSSTLVVPADDDIREAWINAVFGTDFFATPSYQAPRQGVGLAQIPSFLAYTVTIPPSGDDKVGMILSNIALGVHVKSVVEGSEAHCAGIRAGSILVRLNGMGMLGEPSKQALERLWQYEGHFLSTDSPVVQMDLIQNGALYSVVLLGRPPYGISWAPCGNFPLVQRSYSFASAAGVRRGSLVAEINGTSMRNMDHTVAATLIQNLKDADLNMTLVFTPAAARSGQGERAAAAAAAAAATTGTRTAVSTQDGVEVRVHPLAYSIGTLFSKGAPPAPKAASSGGPVSELASRVVAGQAAAPTGFNKDTKSLRSTPNDRTYRPCPPLQDLVKQWNAWDALVYCLQFQQSSYQNLVVVMAQSTPQSALEILQESSDPLLLPCVSLVCETKNQDLMFALLDRAGKNEDFRQQLFFLLRSYTASLELKCKDNDDDALIMLQSAQLELTDLMKDESSMVQVTSSFPDSLDIEDELEVPASSGGVSSLSKKKSVFRMFRKKNGSKSSPDYKTQQLQSSQQPSEAKIPNMPPIQSTTQTSLHPASSLFENMMSFISELDSICITVERALLKSISQKIADWALQPWSLSKQKALVAVTEGMRETLGNSTYTPLTNPMESSEVLVSVDPHECYILPSAHFPVLLTFNVAAVGKDNVILRNPVFQEERLYRTRVEVVSLRGSNKSPMNAGGDRSYFVHGAVSGTVIESGRSVRTDRKKSAHSWEKGSLLTFDTRSSWGPPQTLSLRLSSVDRNDDGNDKVAHADDKGTLHYSSEAGFCWIDLKPLWGRIDASSSTFATVMCHAQICPLEAIENFDEHGDLVESPDPVPERFEIELRVTTELLPFDEPASGFQSRKRMLLYKHDDDLRQELFAIEFIETCDALLKASGLDLSLLTFRCTPVGAKQGFIEWVPGSVPLSDICKPHGEPSFSRNVSEEGEVAKGDKSLAHQQSEGTLSEVAKAGLTKYQSLHRLEPSTGTSEGGSNNPIQEFLRGAAYDPDAPYFIQKGVMDTYVKSCAGYCMVTYLLGVGDRHLDNLLLHQTGHFFHCDFSFILGEDPKKYLPMRITEDMVLGMGGKESDNYAMFLSLVGAAFLALRRHENVRVLLSLVRMMVGNANVSIHSNPDEALTMMRDRFCLDLNDAEAVLFIENLIESNISSRLWMAVDAIHSLGKRFYEV